MPFKVVRFDSTPNPNATKIILDAPISDRPRSFFNAEQAAEDPIAAALFAVPGVTNVLLNGDWLSICKSPDTRWPTVKRNVQAVLARLP